VDGKNKQVLGAALHLPSDNCQPGLPCPGMDVLDMSDLPENPWANNDCPE
jgi:hypothetical protein